MSSFDPFAKDVAAVPVAPSEGLSAEQKRRLEVAPPLEEYVAAEVAITQRMVDNGVFLKDEDGGVGRLARTASYARWRWNGWVACEIESL